MNKKTDTINVAIQTLCGNGKKKWSYVAPTIEITIVEHTENLLSNSTRLRPASQVLVEDWDDEGINSEDITLP